MDALTAAVAVAGRCDIDAGDAAVLRSLRSTVVQLRPSPVLARVAPLADIETVRREVAVAGYLAARGGPVASPYADAGPHEQDGFVVSLWDVVDHDPGRALDGRAAGAALRQVHDLLEDYPAEGLPHFVRLQEVRSTVEALDLTTEDAERLGEMVALAEQRLAARAAPLMPAHGDAWLGNVLRTPDGPVWSDFERVCLGPRELDLACNETAARRRPRQPEDDDFLAGYGDFDAGLLEWVTPLELVPLTAWTYQLAVDRPEFLEPARTRLTWALEGLRAGSGA